jgi:murein DD-endopeptidase MepM/ murein hydrolase activator NlpD
MHVISQSVSLSIVVEKDSPKTQDALIEFEVLQVMLKNSRKKAKELSIKFIANKKNIEMLRTHATTLESSIASIDQKQKKLIKITSEYKKAIKKLELAKTSYKKELKDIINKQNALKKTLAQLNLIKIDEIKRAKEQKEREEAFKNKNIVANENLPKVKKHGSSYQAVKTIKYHGAKTIAPLKSYVITKKYGTYTDPIYGIKIFNESISLRPKTSDTKVKTVFNGKVIYAQKTAVLKNVVVVEHKNGLHTIYANLSKIAPNIKKGKKVKKGSVIGRIKDELTFEVTYKNYHINPIRLFN